MTPEIPALALAALLQVVQFGLFATPANIELTPKYTSSPRERPPSREMTTLTARLQRALNNHFEGLMLFTIALVVFTRAQFYQGAFIPHPTPTKPPHPMIYSPQPRCVAPIPVNTE